MTRNSRTKPIACKVSILMLSSALLTMPAGAPAMPERQAAALAAAHHRVAAAARNTKGVPRAQLDTHRVRLNRLIAALERGEMVAAEEIEAVLRRSRQLTR